MDGETRRCVWEHISSRADESSPILHFVIKAKLSMSAPLTLTNSHYSRWCSGEVERYSLVEDHDEIKLINVKRQRGRFPWVNKVTSWLMEQLAPRHDIIDLLAGFDLFKTAVRAHKYVFAPLAKIIRIIRAVRAHYDLMMTCQPVSCDQSGRIHHK